LDSTGIVGFGRTYYIGRSEAESVKLDLFYHDDIADPYEIIDGIRLVSAEDVSAMKIDVVSRGGRKKDFWDLDMLLGHFSIEEMIGFTNKIIPPCIQGGIIGVPAIRNLAPTKPAGLCIWTNFKSRRCSEKSWSDSTASTKISRSNGRRFTR
jgi:hypothetical protein